VTQPVIIAVSDLLFQSRIAAAVRAAGADPVIADTEALLSASLDAGAAAPIVVDLHERHLDPLAAIRSASAAGRHVLAFGRHTEPATLRAARDAGATTVVPRSQLAEELPALLAKLLPSPADERHP
jgi:hypothetical protein